MLYNRNENLFRSILLIFFTAWINFSLVSISFSSIMLKFMLYLPYFILCSLILSISFINFLINIFLMNFTFVGLLLRYSSTLIVLKLSIIYFIPKLKALLMGYLIVSLDLQNRKCFFLSLWIRTVI